LTVHNHLVRSSTTFVAGKEPATHKRNPEGAEITWISPSASALGGSSPGLSGGCSLTVNTKSPQYPAAGTVFPSAAARTPGNVSHPLQQCFIECVHLLRRVVFLFRQAVLQREHVFGNASHMAERSRRKLLSSSPAATSKTTVIAISAVRMTFAAPCAKRCSLLLRAEVCRAFSMVLPVVESAGSKPATSAAANISRHANAITAPSRWMLLRGGQVFPRMREQPRSKYRQQNAAQSRLPRRSTRSQSTVRESRWHAALRERCEWPLPSAVPRPAQPAGWRH